MSGRGGSIIKGRTMVRGQKPPGHAMSRKCQVCHNKHRPVVRCQYGANELYVCSECRRLNAEIEHSQRMLERLFGFKEGD